MRPLLLTALLSATTLVTFGQTPLEPDDVRVTYGVKVGVQMLDSFDTAPGYNAENSRFVVGGMADLRINDYFGGEFNVLYRQFRVDALLSAPFPSDYAVSVNRAHAFDFPLLFKWKPMGNRDISPYVDSGIAFRVLNGNEKRRFFAGDDRESESSNSFVQDSNFNVGWVVGGGVVFDHSENVSLAPEIRYTVWSRDNFRAASTLPGFPGTLSSTNNQLEILLGITF